VLPVSDVHRFDARVIWTSDAKGPTTSYASYSREHRIEISGKPTIRGSADPAFRGDGSAHNPEDLLVAAVAGCHMLSYLALCARAGIAELRYEDHASGTLAVKDGRTRFTEALLRPRVTLAAGNDSAQALALHKKVEEICFIANSVNFPVRCEATVVEASAADRAAARS
jgi:organic hydroperoxide reductase OsmC/OhrA